MTQFLHLSPKKLRVSTNSTTNPTTNSITDSTTDPTTNPTTDPTDPTATFIITDTKSVWTESAYFLRAPLRSVRFITHACSSPHKQSARPAFSPPQSKPTSRTPEHQFY